MYFVLSRERDKEKNSESPWGIEISRSDALPLSHRDSMVSEAITKFIYDTCLMETQNFFLLKISLTIFSYSINISFLFKSTLLSGPTTYADCWAFRRNHDRHRGRTFIGGNLPLCFTRTGSRSLLERSSQTLGSPFTPFSLTFVFEWLQVAKVIEASLIFDYRLNGLMQRLKHWGLTLLK